MWFHISTIYKKKLFFQNHSKLPIAITLRHQHLQRSSIRKEGFRFQIIVRDKNARSRHPISDLFFVAAFVAADFNSAGAVKKKKLLFQTTPPLIAITISVRQHLVELPVDAKLYWDSQNDLDSWYQTTGSDLPDARPDWRPDQQESWWYTRSVQVISGGYQGNPEINRGFFGEFGDCCQINPKSTNICTSKNIRFHKNAILFIYIQILQFYSFCLFFEYCQKSHIWKKCIFIKIAYFLKK